MKSFLFCACFVPFCENALLAQRDGNMLGVNTKGYATSPAVTRPRPPTELEIAQRRLMLLAARYPTRTIDDKKHDLRPFFQALTDLSQRPKADFEFIHGKVIQILPDGIILWNEEGIDDGGDRKRILLKNFYAHDSIVDGDLLVAYAVPATVFVYRDISNVQRTIRAYDCGAVDPAESKVRFELAPWRPELKRTEVRAPINREAEIDYNMALGLRTRLMAASNGVGRAQYSIGLAYLRGDGLPQNPDLARYWLGRAATNGYPDALKQLPP